MDITVREIIQNTLMLLDLDERIGYADPRDADVMLFVKLFNLISVTLAARLPLSVTETVRANASGDFYYRDLARPATKILSVRHAGASVAGARLSDRFCAGLPGAELHVTYAYRPEPVGMEDNSAFDTANLTAAVLSYALAGEYCLVMGMYDQAEQWQSRFETEYRRTVLPTAARIPARSFV